MSIKGEPLRVGLIVGTLNQGGAEKQLLFFAKALQQVGADVQVFSLTTGEYYENRLVKLGLAPIWIGKSPDPVHRIVTLYRLTRLWKPHLLQSTHFYTNLYASVVAGMVNAISIGAIRSDPYREIKANGIWGGLLLQSPMVLMANSLTAHRIAAKICGEPSKVFLLHNVIDLLEFDQYEPSASFVDRLPKDAIRVFAISRLVPVKRVDNFLRAIALAVKEVHNLRGYIVGDGPEKIRLERLANEMGLLPDHIQFLGQRDDVSSLLRYADIFVISSEKEGFPNVILEAMAARVPVVTTPVGDARVIVQHGTTGYVTEGQNPEALADMIIRLSQSAQLRNQMGTAGRKRVEQTFSEAELPGKILSIYRSMAEHEKNKRLLRVLETRYGPS